MPLAGQPDSLSYNGVEMAIICQKQISRRHIMSHDGTTYLYTQWVFDVRCHVNPQTLAYISLNPGATPVMGAPAGAVPVNNIARGILPAMTDQFLRSLLSQPRKPLQFIQNGVIVLLTPAPGCQTDAANGPFCEVNNVYRDQGGHTWVVDIKLVANIHECPQGDPPVLISNRWLKLMDTDGDYLSKVVTAGECVFDSARLLQTDTLPDNYRINLFQTIPFNCKRTNIQVTAQSDGVTYNYTYVDEEQHFNTAPATRVECYQTSNYGQTDFTTALAEQGQQAIGRILSGGDTLGIAAAAFNAAVASVPKFQFHILVRVWGSRLNTKTQLLNMALGVAFERMFFLKNRSLIISVDHVGKMVEVQLTVRTGGEEMFNSIWTKQEDYTAAVATALASYPSLAAFGGRLANTQVPQTLNSLATLGGIPGGALVQFAANFATFGLFANQIVGTGPLLPKGIVRALASLGPSGPILDDSPGGVPIGAPPWYSLNDSDDPNTKGPATTNVPPPASQGSRGTLIIDLITAALTNPCGDPANPYEPVPPEPANVPIFANLEGSGDTTYRSDVQASQQDLFDQTFISQ